MGRCVVLGAWIPPRRRISHHRLDCVPYGLQDMLVNCLYVVDKRRYEDFLGVILVVLLEVFVANLELAVDIDEKANLPTT